jgi:hypothetical protein
MTWCRPLLVLAVAIASLGKPAEAQVLLDRLLAVVDGYIITLSDARAALRFGLVPSDVSTDPIAAALRRLIDRRLMLAEVERYALPEPATPLVEARVAAIEGRFKDALDFEIALNQAGMSRDDLRRVLRESLRIDAYVEQRFASAAAPSDDDLANYYKDHPAEFTTAGRLRPLDEVRETVRARVMDQQRAAFVQQWVDGLRRRSSILVQYLPGR